MNVETTPAREVCQGFECPNDNEEGGLFQVESYLIFPLISLHSLFQNYYDDIPN